MTLSRLLLSKKGVVRLSAYCKEGNDDGRYAKRWKKMEESRDCPSSANEEMKNDVLVLGNVLYALTDKVHPCESIRERNLREGVICYGCYMHRGNRSDELFDFIMKCSMEDVEKRWSVDELMNVSTEGESDQ